MWPEIIAAAGPLLGGLLGMQGTRETNQSNRDIATQTSAFNAEEAKKNREWQEMMSDTAHQREAADLEKAGLSPLLAAKGGASTPSGSSAQGVSSTMENPYANLDRVFSSAIQAYKTAGEIKMQQAQAENIDADTAKKRADTESTKKDFPKQDLFNDFWNTVRGMVKPAKQIITDTAKKVDSSRPLSPARMKLDRKKLFQGTTSEERNLDFANP